MEIDWDLASKIATVVGAVVGAAAAIFNLMAANAAKSAATEASRAASYADAALKQSKEIALLPYNDKYHELYLGLFTRLRQSISGINGLTYSGVFCSGGPVDIFDHYASHSNEGVAPRHVLDHVIEDILSGSVDPYDKRRIEHKWIDEEAKKLRLISKEDSLCIYCEAALSLIRNVATEISQHTQDISDVMVELESLKENAKVSGNTYRLGYQSISYNVDRLLEFAHVLRYWFGLAKTLTDVATNKKQSASDNATLILEILAVYKIVLDLTGSNIK
mgnify:CR=1 FL=1